MLQPNSRGRSGGRAEARPFAHWSGPAALQAGDHRVLEGPCRLIPLSLRLGAGLLFGLPLGLTFGAARPQRPRDGADSSALPRVSGDGTNQSPSRGPSRCALDGSAMGRRVGPGLAHLRGGVGVGPVCQWVDLLL